MKLLLMPLKRYRTKEEESQFESNDCIDKLSNWLLANRDFNEDDLKAMNKSVKQQIREAVKWAEASPEPDIKEELYKDVYVEEWGPWNGTSLPEMLQD